MAKKEKIFFWVFLAGWAALLSANRTLGDCWFYNDEAGEYAFSEMATLLFYLISFTMLIGVAARHQNKRKIFLCAALFTLWLFLEEANYGQILLNQSPTNYYDDREQSSLHTALLRPVYFTRTLDLAEILSLAVLALIAAGIPLGLKFGLKLSFVPYALWLPLAIALFCYLGEWIGFVTPWECGYDSFEEIIETLMASSTVYYSLLLKLKLEEPNEVKGIL